MAFLRGNIDWISGDKWAAFLDEQKQLLLTRSERAKRGEPLVTAAIELPDGTRLDGVGGDSMLTDEWTNGMSSESGNRTQPAWYRPPIQNDSVKRTLSFSNLISDPVTIRFTNGIPDATNYVFRMRKAR